MAAHSSILAWEIPGCRRLVAYGPWGLKTVAHDLATKQQQESALPLEALLLGTLPLDFPSLDIIILILQMWKLWLKRISEHLKTS